MGALAKSLQSRAGQYLETRTVAALRPLLAPATPPRPSISGETRSQARRRRRRHCSEQTDQAHVQPGEVCCLRNSAVAKHAAAEHVRCAVSIAGLRPC